MRAILFKNGIEQRRGEYPDVGMKLINFKIKGKKNPDNYEWKLIVDGERPIINEIERLERSEVDNDKSHPEHSHLKVIDIVYSKVKKSDDEIIEMIKGHENNANEQLIGHTDRLKSMYLYMSILHRKIKGLNISAKQQAILDKGDAKAVKVWKNDTKLKAKLKDLSDGKNVDVKIGWTNE